MVERLERYEKAVHRRCKTEKWKQRENRGVCIACAYESTITGKDSPISCMFAVSQYN